jgi:PAS domain-containing protein
MREPNGYRSFDKQQILAIEAICAISCIAAFFLLKHVWLSHLSAGWSEATVLILALLWTAPAYRLLYRHASAIPERSNHEVDLEILRTVIDSLPDRIYVKDRQSKFILTNRSLREFSAGSPDTDIIGKDDFCFFPSPIAARFFKDEQKIMDNGEPVGHSGWDKDVNGNHVWTLTTRVSGPDSTETLGRQSCSGA